MAFEGMHVADLDGDGRDDLLIAGTDRFGVLQTGRKGQRLKDDRQLRDEAQRGAAVGPGRRRPERRRRARRRLHRHRRAIARDRHLRGLRRPAPRHHVPVFERKIFRGAGDLAEPRDLAIGDVDGDGRDDLVLIVHDRVLVLRQDAGTSERKPGQAAAKPTTASTSER